MHCEVPLPDTRVQTQTLTEHTTDHNLSHPMSQGVDPFSPLSAKERIAAKCNSASSPPSPHGPTTSLAAGAQGREATKAEEGRPNASAGETCRPLMLPAGSVVFCSRCGCPVVERAGRTHLFNREGQGTREGERGTNCGHRQPHSGIAPRAEPSTSAPRRKKARVRRSKA